MPGEGEAHDAPGFGKVSAVLMYHEISEPTKATWDHLAVSPSAFKEQLDYLLNPATPR
jgi:hypothetical protein